jgi:ABC-type branched-subunit amino acid transport system permease subunit
MKTLKQPWAIRLGSCLGGSLVLALMVGNQEGTLNGDFGIAFFQAYGLHKGTSTAWHFPLRAAIFLAIGLVVFALLSFWRYVVPYLRSPGMRPLGAGFIAVIIAQTVMNWYDPIQAYKNATNSRFFTIKPVVQTSSVLSGLTDDFFVWLAWVLIVVTVASCAASIVVRRLKWLGYLTFVLGVVSAYIAYSAHHKLANAGRSLPQPQDHALGVYADVIGFLLIGFAGLTAVWARSDVADTRVFLTRVTTWRPGLPLVAIGIVFGFLAYGNDCWYAPLTRNADLSATHDLFAGTGVSSLATQYLGWLGWTLFGVVALIAVAATYLSSKALAWLSLAFGFVGIVLTFLTLHSMTFTAFRIAPNDGQRWGNVGDGGFTAFIVFALFAAAGMQVLLSGGKVTTSAREWASDLPVTAMVMKVRASAQLKTLILVGLAVAIFYPPMLTVTWQNVLVTQIGEYVLLAIGLNVVVGWAGLLDLGYIAFYAIGSYTTAYITGSLPVKPPSWLHFSPLLAIPFAIVACLIAGLILGAPTLRLRGDYLAIVTLGFGEIITVVATNNPFHITGGPVGPTVPNPTLHIGPIHITWGEDNLPYWYLLLVIMIVVLVLFYRLEGSRLGRAWAAIREDEVAAQASGVNTTRVKLLAFAIGASTSGLAGVFFATQVGYFDPSVFTLQASILIVAYVVFGGMGSLPGAIAGAAVLTWLPQFLKAQVPANDRPMWVGAAILAMMIFRPAGLLPARRRKAELEGLDGATTHVAALMAVPASEGL